jgi:hypothetical protein
MGQTVGIWSQIGAKTAAQTGLWSEPRRFFAMSGDNVGVLNGLCCQAIAAKQLGSDLSRAIEIKHD